MEKVEQIKKKIETLKKGIESRFTPENIKEKFKKSLTILEEELKAAEIEAAKTEAAEDLKDEKTVKNITTKKRGRRKKTESKTETKKDKAVSIEKKSIDKKKGLVSKIDISETKDYVIYKKKKYTLDDCEALFNAWNEKREKASEASQKSVAKSTTDKILNKAEVAFKQILSDKNAKKKIKENPSQAKREILRIQKYMRAWIEAVEEFIGKKIGENKLKKLFSVLNEIDLMEDGGTFNYEDIFRD